MKYFLTILGLNSFPDFIGSDHFLKINVIHLKNGLRDKINVTESLAYV